jgi:eukaryotic-like serine/threonine-protein kinase
MSVYSNRSLADWLQQHSPGTLSSQEIVFLVRQAANALQDVYNRRLVYRNVNPHNFLIRLNEATLDLPDLQLIDPGNCVPPSVGPSPINQPVTNDPLYVAPEQWSGRVFLATDQYALAIMAYQLLTMRVPFQGTQQQVMDQHLHAEPRPPSTLGPRIPLALDVVILKALAKKPQDRYPNISDFAEAFEKALLGTAPPVLTSTIPRLVDNATSVKLLSRSAQLRAFVLLGLVFIVIVGTISSGFFSIVRSNQAAASAKASAVLFDPLSNNSHGRWINNISRHCFFRDDTYHLFASTAGALIVCPSSKLSVHNGAIKIDVALITASIAGLMFRFTDQKHQLFFYSFNITNQGDVFLVRVNGSSAEHTIILAQVSHVVAPSRKPNTLLVEARNNDFRLFVNGVLVAVAQDSAFSNGLIGFDAENGDASFSNLAISPL